MSGAELAFGLYGRRAGLISRDRGRTTLRYDADYVAQENATPLSLSMPVSDTEYQRRYVEAYLKGLLPDRTDVQERWAREFGVRPGDTLGLIAAIGRDTAGAAIFAPPDELDGAMRSSGDVEPVTEPEIATRLRNLRTDPAAWHDLGEHWSLAGAQGKLALVRTADGWGYPSGSAPSTHIVKPGIVQLPAQALAEHVSMRTLALVGLEVATTAYREFEDQPAIVVERYDRRRRPDGKLVRVHQEDLVQTFGLVPQRKYEADGGPGVQQIAARLRDVTRDSSAERFVTAVVANYLVGAPDAHAKNYALLLVGRQARLAPLYDVSTGLLADGAGRLMFGSAAQSIGGEKRFGEVEERHWRRFATATGTDVGWVLDTVGSLAEAIPDAMSDAIAELPVSAAGRTAMLREIQPRITALARQTLWGLHHRRHEGRVTDLWFDSLHEPAAEGERRWGE